MNHHKPRMGKKPKKTDSNQDQDDFQALSNEWYTLDDGNFDEFDWKHRKNIRVQSCSKEVKPKMLLGCDRSLRYLDMIGCNYFLNLSTFLRGCQSITKVIFTSVILLDYKKETTTTTILLPRLAEIHFVGKKNLTVDELLVIDYFYRRLRLPNVNSICFEQEIEKINDSEESPTTSSATQEGINNGVSVDNEILTGFMVQNIAKFKNVVLERTNIKLFDDDVVLDRFKLSKLVCDMSSVSFLRTIKNQTMLRILDCFHTENISACAMDAVFTTILKCSATLREIRILHKLILNGMEESEEDSSTELFDIVHDCTVYRSCKRLTSLNIICVSIAANADPSNLSSSVQPRGVIINLHFLPTSLSSLIIRFDLINEHDMDNFARKFYKFVNLKHFIFHGNPQTSYDVKLRWIQTLINLPKMLIFEFHFCEVEHGQAVKTFIDSISGLASKLEITRDSCIFRQTENVS